MSGPARLALTAALATLLSACALLPLVDPATWLMRAVVLVLAIAGCGALARRLPVPRPAVVGIQFLAALLLLVWMFASGQAPAGILPSPAALQELGMLAQTGGEDVSRFATPAPLSDGIELLLVGGVAVVALLVDVIAVTYRSAAPAGLPLLALYSVAAGLSEGGAAGAWFVLAAGGYLLLLLAEGRDRLTRWGRVFTAAPRGGGPVTVAGPHRPTPVRAGHRIGVAALAIAVLAPLGLPALDGGMFAPDRDDVQGPGGGDAAVDPVVALQNSLNQPEDREVLTYRTQGAQTQGLYLRIVSLDRFDGSTWRPARRGVTDVPSPFPNPPGLGQEVRAEDVSLRVSTAAWYAQDWLPMPYPANGVRLDGRWQFEPVGRTVVGDRGQDTKDIDYDVAALLVQPTAKQLAEAPPPDTEVRRNFTEVPDSLPGDVASTALSITEGTADDYEAAVALQDWFAVDGGFTYDTDVRAGTGPGAISRFLRDREGFCVHFSFAMAAMARTLGIPARVAVGFAPGSPQSDGSMSVGLKDAHAWPELYFEGAGWTRFEPTPSRGAVPDYAQDLPPTPEDPAPEASPSPSDSHDTPERPGPGAECESRGPGSAAGRNGDRPGGAGGDPAAPQRGHGQPDPVGTSDDCGPAAPAEAGGADGAAFRVPRTVVLSALGAVATVGILLLPMLLRRRNTSLRLRRTGTGQESAVRVWDEVQDTAWDYGIFPDLSLTPRRAAARIVHGMKLSGPPAEAAHRLAGAVEQALYAPHPVPVTGLAEDARLLASALGEQAGRPARLRARFWPRSMARLLHSATDRRRAAGTWVVRAAGRLRTRTGG